MMTVTIAALVALALIGAYVWMFGALVVWTVHNPLTFLGDCGLLLGLLTLFVLFVLTCVAGETLIKRHCPPLTVQD